MNIWRLATEFFHVVVWFLVVAHHLKSRKYYNNNVSTFAYLFLCVETTLQNIYWKCTENFLAGLVQSATNNSRRTVCYINTIIRCTTKANLVVQLMDATSKQALEAKFRVI